MRHLALMEMTGIIQKHENRIMGDAFENVHEETHIKYLFIFTDSPTRGTDWGRILIDC
jgi:hypothetical protein